MQCMFIIYRRMESGFEYIEMYDNQLGVDKKCSSKDKVQ